MSEAPGGDRSTAADEGAPEADGLAAVRDPAGWLEGLTPDQRRELAMRHYVRVGPDLVWIELGGQVRREAASRLYYVQTDRGVYRVSRLTGEVVEV